MKGEPAQNPGGITGKRVGPGMCMYLAAIGEVADQWVPEVAGVDADLMRPARERLEHHEGVVGVLGNHTVFRDRRLTVLGGDFVPRRSYHGGYSMPRWIQHATVVILQHGSGYITAWHGGYSMPLWLHYSMARWIQHAKVDTAPTHAGAAVREGPFQTTSATAPSIRPSAGLGQPCTSAMYSFSTVL